VVFCVIRMHFPCSPRHRPLIGCNRGAFTAGACKAWYDISCDNLDAARGTKSSKRPQLFLGAAPCTVRSLLGWDGYKSGWARIVGWGRCGECSSSIDSSLERDGVHLYKELLGSCQKSRCTLRRVFRLQAYQGALHQRSAMGASLIGPWGTCRVIRMPSAASASSCPALPSRSRSGVGQAMSWWASTRP
jgi:hypothetical protein